MAATIECERLGHGRGGSAAESRRRALGEMVELASCCAWGDEAIFDAPLARIAGRAWSPADVAGFADWQRRDRACWNKLLEGLDWIPPGSPPERPIGWMAAMRLDTGGEVFVPADCVLIGRREIGDADACAVADTNGCAAGADAESALLAALYELIERDATGRWWYGRQPSRQIDPARIELGEPVVRSLAGRRRVLWLLDITSDIAVPTVAAMATDLGGRHVSAGFATRSGLDAAAATALTELMQMELKIEAALAHPDLVTDLDAWFHEVDFGGSAPFVSADGEDRQPLASDIEQGLPACLGAIVRAGCRVAAIELTRPSFGIPVYRAISPDLCHWKPRFGPPRHSGPGWSAHTNHHSVRRESCQPLLRI